jgi:hypothetical protein
MGRNPSTSNLLLLLLLLLFELVSCSIEWLKKLCLNVEPSVSPKSLDRPLSRMEPLRPLVQRSSIETVLNLFALAIEIIKPSVKIFSDKHKVGFKIEKIIILIRRAKICVLRSWWESKLGMEKSQTELGSAHPSDELEKAARSWLASQLTEPTSLAINVNLLSKL